MRAKEAEIETHNKLKPAEVTKPTSGTTGSSEIEPIDKELESLRSEIAILEPELAEVKKRVQDFTQIKQAIERGVPSRGW